MPILLQLQLLSLLSPTSPVANSPATTIAAIATFDVTSATTFAAANVTNIVDITIAVTVSQMLLLPHECMQPNISFCNIPFVGSILKSNILQLIAFVEGKTQRTIADRDVVMSNFRTVRTIATRFLDPR